MRGIAWTALLTLVGCSEPPLSVSEAPERVVHARAPIEETAPESEEPARIERANGLVIDIEEQGQGPLLRHGDRIRLHLVGHVEGTEAPFFSTRVSGIPMSLHLETSGPETPVEGLRLALCELRVGTRASVRVPADLAYGDRGLESAGIPADSRLLFDVHVKARIEE